MAFHQVRDIMRKSCRDHEAVVEFYDELVELAGDDERLKYILNLMIEHQETIIHCIKEYLKTKDSSVLNSWFQYLPDMPVPTESLVELNDINQHSAWSIFNEVNQKFLMNYEKLSNFSHSESVHELFQEMKNLTSHEGEREGWRYIMLDDI